MNREMEGLLRLAPRILKKGRVPLMTLRPKKICPACQVAHIRSRAS